MHGIPISYIHAISQVLYIVCCIVMVYIQDRYKKYCISTYVNSTCSGFKIRRRHGDALPAGGPLESVAISLT